jgi:hypothetical protein
LALCFALVQTPGARAQPALQTITRNALQAGWYERSGPFIGTSEGGSNYFVGALGGEHRNFFVFDLAALAGEIRSARLNVWQPPMETFAPHGMRLPTGQESYHLFHVATPVNTLLEYGGGQNTWQDLGTGASYGSRVYTAADAGTLTSIELNAAALNEIESRLNSRFAIGGALVPYTPESGFLFGNSGHSVEIPRVSLTLSILVPEPGGLGAVMFLGLLLCRRA